MARLEDAVRAINLDDAAGVVVDVLGSDRTAIWRTAADKRSLLAGTAVDGVATAAATGLCRATIEVAADADPALLEMAAALLATVSDRLAIEDRGRHARRQLADSERIGALGTYAWDMETGELEWSEGLFRIYGHEPDAFTPSYEHFTSQLHPDDRERVRRIHERSLQTGEPFEMEERIVRPDGAVRTLWSIGEIHKDGDGAPSGIVGVCRDVTEQREAERRVADADLRRRQAIELNDNVIQGLVTLLWQLDGGDDGARQTADATLAAARRMITDLLRETGVAEFVRQLPVQLHVDASSDGEPTNRTSAGLAAATPTATDDAARGDGTTAEDEPTTTGAGGGVLHHTTTTTQTGIRVLLADDLPALRTLLRMQLSRREGICVVGEASDGEQAVQLTERLRPDVVVMDLSMPKLDGLEATRRIRELVPTTTVIVLSGYPAETVGSDAVDAGAACYLEKSSDVDALCAAILQGHTTGDLGP